MYMAPPNTTMPITVATPTAPPTEEASSTREMARTRTPMPTAPRTGISIGRMRRSRSSRLVAGSPVARSDQLVIVHSNPTAARMHRPTTNTAASTTRPTATTPRPTAAKTGHQDRPTATWASGATSRPSTSAVASASPSRKTWAVRPRRAITEAPNTRRT